jgi:hypothetical protein
MNKTKKIYHIEVDVVDGKMNMQRTCDGFNPLELLGVLALTQNEISQQMRGTLPKDIDVRRKVILDEANPRTMDEELCIRAYRLGFEARYKNKADKNPFGPGDKQKCWQLGYDSACENKSDWPNSDDMQNELYQLIYINHVPWRKIPKDNVKHYIEGFRSQYDNKTSMEPENPYIGGSSETPSKAFEAWDAGFSYYVKLWTVMLEGHRAHGQKAAKSTNPHNEPFMNYVWELGYDKPSEKQSETFREFIGNVVERTINFKDTVAEKHSQGYRAFMSNVPKEANPYDVDEFFEVWNKGWERAEENQKSGKTNTFSEMNGIEEDEKPIEWFDGFVAQIKFMINPENQKIENKLQKDTSLLDDFNQGIWDCVNMIEYEKNNSKEEECTEFIGLEAIEGFLNETENLYNMLEQPWKHILWERAYIEASKTMSSYRTIAHNKGFEDASNDIRFNPYRDKIQQNAWEMGFKEYITKTQV